MFFTCPCRLLFSVSREQWQSSRWVCLLLFLWGCFILCYVSSHRLLIMLLFCRGCCRGPHCKPCSYTTKFPAGRDCPWQWARYDSIVSVLFDLVGDGMGTDLFVWGFHGLCFGVVFSQRLVCCDILKMLDVSQQVVGLGWFFSLMISQFEGSNHQMACEGALCSCG